jgi:hypothetical protein
MERLALLQCRYTRVPATTDLLALLRPSGVSDQPLPLLRRHALRRHREAGIRGNGDGMDLALFFVVDACFVFVSACRSRAFCNPNAQIIFGLEVTDITSGHCKILLNPGPLRVPDKRSFTVRGFVIAKDEVRCARTHRRAHPASSSVLMHGSQSISFITAQGIPSYNIWLGRGKHGRGRGGRGWAAMFGLCVFQVLRACVNEYDCQLALLVLPLSTDVP